jgi:HEPN domain-containing protein
MKDVEHARLMVQLARNELTVLKALQSAPDEATSAFGFHAQQAVEKALKAWLSLAGVAYPRTHALSVLFDLLLDGGVNAAIGFRDLEDLSPFAVQYRYEALADSETVDRPAMIEKVAVLIVHVEHLVADAA